MKKTFLIIFFCASIKSFAQADSAYSYNTPIHLNDGLVTASLSDVEIDSTKIIELTNKILNHFYVNVHSLLIVRTIDLCTKIIFPDMKIRGTVIPEL